jgi:hypothetical protein
MGIVPWCDRIFATDFSVSSLYRNVSTTLLFRHRLGGLDGFSLGIVDTGSSV